MLRAQTIYALSTPLARSPIAIIRVSGSEARKVISDMTNIPLDSLRARTTYHASIHHPLSRELIDLSLLLFFQGPRSYTGEDTVELHVHGSIPIIDSLFGALASFPSLRPASPGEFTRRAVENGKLNLLQAEAINDLINSKTRTQAEYALKCVQNSSTKSYSDLYLRIVRISSYIEAAIDFSEEAEDSPELFAASKTQARDLVQFIQKVSRSTMDQMMVYGPRVVLCGKPNVGKSTLFNRILGRQAAIVTAIPGTTRDVLEAEVVLAGHLIRICDTAGLHPDGDDIVENEGIRLCREMIGQADILLVLLSGAEDDDPEINRLKADPRALCVLNRFGHPDGSIETKSLINFSCKDGPIDGLVEALSRHVTGILRTSDNLSAVDFNLKARHRNHLDTCVRHLELFLSETDIVLAAEHLRSGCREIEKIVGTITSEKILEEVFRNFCVGK